VVVEDVIEVVVVVVVVVVETVVLENATTLIVPFMKLACGWQKYAYVPSRSANHFNEYAVGPKLLGPTIISLTAYPSALVAFTAKSWPASK